MFFWVVRSQFFRTFVDPVAIRAGKHVKKPKQETFEWQANAVKEESTTATGSTKGEIAASWSFI